MNTKKTPTIRATIGEMNQKKPARQESTPLSFVGSLIARDADGELRDVVTVRCYYSERGNGMQPVRASVWIATPRNSGKEWRTGRGNAGGCGYHKESAAIAEALDNAGILLWGNVYCYSSEKPNFKKRVHFGGTGSSAYADIFKAVARAMGFKGRMVWVSH